MSRVADVEERRRQILRAAVEVFAERGFADATISEIADAAGLAHGTVYLYFKSKVDVFQSLVSGFVDLLIADVNGSGALDDENKGLADDLHRMFYRSLSLCARNPRAAAVCMRESASGGHELAEGLEELTRSLLDQLAARIGRAVEMGEVRPIAPDFAAFLVVNLLGVAIRRLLSLGPNALSSERVEQLAREMVGFVWHGLAAGAPVARLGDRS